MSVDQQASQRINFFEQLHQEFLYLKGYGTYAYMTSHDVDRLYNSYLMQQETLAPSAAQQDHEISFIRAFIKSCDFLKASKSFQPICSTEK